MIELKNQKLHSCKSSLASARQTASDLKMLQDMLTTRRQYLYVREYRACLERMAIYYFAERHVHLLELRFISYTMHPTSLLYTTGATGSLSTATLFPFAALPLLLVPLIVQFPSFCAPAGFAGAIMKPSKYASSIGVSSRSHTMAMSADVLRSAR